MGKRAIPQTSTQTLFAYQCAHAKVQTHASAWMRVLLTRHAHTRDHIKVCSSQGMRLQQACTSPYRPLLPCTMELRRVAAKTPCEY